MYSPRQQMPLEYSMKDGMTCANIMHPGAVVLMPSMMMDSMGMMDDMMMDSMDKMDDMMDSMQYAMMKDSMDSMVSLEGCEVTARYNLNFRNEPGGEKIGLVQADMTRSAMARTPNWFKVMYDDAEGWISSHYISSAGDCG